MGTIITYHPLAPFLLRSPLEIRWKSSRSPVDWGLSKYYWFLPQSIRNPAEVRWKSSGSPTDTEFWPVQSFLAFKWFEWTFTGLCLDYQQNPVMSNGLRQTSDGLSTESIGNGRVQRKSVGVHWTSSGNVKYCHMESVGEGKVQMGSVKLFRAYSVQITFGSSLNISCGSTDGWPYVMPSAFGNWEPGWWNKEWSNRPPYLGYF